MSELNPFILKMTRGIVAAFLEARRGDSGADIDPKIAQVLIHPL